MSIPFQNEWYDYKVRYFGKAEGSLPEGWRRKEVFPWTSSEAGLRYSKWCRRKKYGKAGLDNMVSAHYFETRYYYEFDAYCSEHSPFRYPIHVGEKLEPAPGGFDIEPPSGRYLCAETTQLKLWAVKAPLRRRLLLRNTMPHGEVVEDSTYSCEEIQERVVRKWIRKLPEKLVNITIQLPLLESSRTKRSMDRCERHGTDTSRDMYGDVDDRHFKFKVSGYTVSGCPVALCDDKGEVAGVLFPNLADDIQKIWDAGRPGIRIDLVAISRGHTIDYPQIKHPEEWNFYHVLWVEWIDGIAYRKGVG